MAKTYSRQTRGATFLRHIGIRARASESIVTSKRLKSDTAARKPATSFVASLQPNGAKCIACKSNQHPQCQKFNNLSHEEKLSIVRANNHCMNCLRTSLKIVSRPIVVKDVRNYITPFFMSTLSIRHPLSS